MIGVLQAHLHVAGSESLKDKRRVVRSLKDKLHREHQVSVAEVASLDRLDLAVLAVSVAAPAGGRAGEVLDAVERKLRGRTDAEVVAIDRQIFDGGPIEPAATTTPDASIDHEMLSRALGGEGDR